MQKNNNLKKELLGWAAALFLPLIVLSFLFSYVCVISSVNQQSMEPNYTKGDVLYYSRLISRKNMPKRGELILFYADQRIDTGLFFELKQRYVDITDRFRDLNELKNVRYVKRVVGLPGDEIDITGGRVYINGVVLSEPYVAYGPTASGGTTYPFLVPVGMLFVMGDNRVLSKDSRAFGAIDLRSVEGVGRIRLWPPNRINRLTNPYQ